MAEHLVEVHWPVIMRVAKALVGLAPFELERLRDQ
jgi:hypothetical protein